MNQAEKTTAYITKNQGVTKIHIGSLSIHIVNEDHAHPGPLGWEDSQEPGIIMWGSNYVKKGEDFFEHGEQKPITHVKRSNESMKRVQDLLDMEVSEK